MKLIKTVTDNYILVDATKEFHGEGYLLGTTTVSDAPRLSLKNCQAIELGYDLDELVKGFIERTGYNDFDSYSYKLGFQKALEILGDKKFSEEDMKNGIEYGIQSVLQAVPGVTSAQSILDIYTQSLQQTEWDVIVDVLLTERHDGVVYETPKLDADGCLILKRK